MSASKTAGGLLQSFALCFVFLSALGSGCGSPTGVIVSVGQIPASATSLVAQARIGALQFETTPTFDISSRTDTDVASSRYSFGLNVQDKSSGQLQISVAALGSGATAPTCLLASTVGEVPLIAGSEPVLSLDLNAASGACNGDLPILQQASQDLYDGKALLALDGFGFEPGSQVMIDGQVQDFVINLSPLRLLTELPSVTAPSGARPVQVQVLLPSGAISNPVSYVALEPWFDTPTTPVYQAVSTAAGIPIYTGAAIGDYNGDKRLDLAASGYFYKDGRGGSGFVDVFLSNGRGVSSTRITSPVWNNTAVADPASVTAQAIVASNYRLTATRDLIVAIADNQNRGGYIVLNNDGKGSFTPTSIAVLDAAFPNPMAIAHVDLDPLNDVNKRPDVALLTTGADGYSTLSTFLSDSSGNPGTAKFFDAGVGKNASGFAVADLNKDGAMDFAIIAAGTNNPSLPQVHAILNYRDGKIYPSFSDSLTNTYIAGFGGGLTTADLLGDGYQYIVASSYTLPADSADKSIQVVGGRDFIQMHPPNGHPNPPDEPALQTMPQRYAAGAHPYSLAALDADHDAFVDLAAALTGDASQPTRIVLLRNRQPAADGADIFPNAGTAMDSLPTLTLWGESGDALLLAGDMNADTFLDLVAVVRGDGPSQRPGSIWFFRNL